MIESQKKVFIVEGLRTPFTKSGKEFNHLHPSVLATHNLREFLHKMEFQGKEIEEVIMGNSFTLPDSTQYCTGRCFTGWYAKKRFLPQPL